MPEGVGPLSFSYGLYSVNSAEFCLHQRLPVSEVLQRRNSPQHVVVRCVEIFLWPPASVRGADSCRRGYRHPGSVNAAAHVWIVVPSGHPSRRVVDDPEYAPNTCIILIWDSSFRAKKAIQRKAHSVELRRPERNGPEVDHASGSLDLSDEPRTRTRQRCFQ